MYIYVFIYLYLYIRFVPGTTTTQLAWWANGKAIRYVYIWAETAPKAPPWMYRITCVGRNLAFTRYCHY